ncbi:MAG: GNAT family N-acetyltransferase [Phyllobacterium sp.]
MIITETERLIIRNWEERDRDLFYEINSDENVMEFFPFRRTHEQSDELFYRNRQKIAETGYGFFALEERTGGECLGFAGLALTSLEPFIPDGSVEIGWRLARRYWGNGYVTEAAKALLELGFNERQLPEIISFAVRDNYRSVAVMHRIGMAADPERDFDHPSVPQSHAILKPHVFYSMTYDRWRHRAA